MPTIRSITVLSWTRKRKYHKRLVGGDKGGEGTHTNYRHGQNRLDLGELIYYRSNWSRVMRNTRKS